MVDAQNDEQATWALLAESLIRAGSALRGAYEKSPGLRVPPVGIDVMSALHRSDRPLTVSEIARDLGRYPSNVSTTVRGLLELELVERISDDRDGRVVRIRPSVKSYAIHAQLLDVWVRSLHEASDEMPRAEQRRMLAAVDALAALADHLERHGAVVEDFTGVPTAPTRTA